VGQSKIFTWGEIVEVPEKQMVTVINASFHAGDIVINGGCDYDNKPARITVPVPYVVTGPSWYPDYPADVRTARRAYLTWSGATLGSNVVVTRIGTRTDGSHNTANEIAPPDIGAGYFEVLLMPAFTEIGSVALGHEAPLQGDDSRPHTLLTVAYFRIIDGAFVQPETTSGTFPTAYYTMEY
jgi:hypothetical protein